MHLSQPVITHTNDFTAQYQRMPFTAAARTENIPPFFAGELAMELINAARMAHPEVMQDGSTDPRFFSAFYHEHKHFFLSHDIHSTDLALIFSKQMMILLKRSGILCEKEGFVCCSRSPVVHTLRHNLFFSFWSGCDWQDLFPSVPEYARLLHSHRLLLIEEILIADSAVSIDALAEEFLFESRCACNDPLLFVSYLDFTMLTWLAHFGFIRYTQGSSYDKVMISVTDAGRSAFRNLLQSAARDSMEIN